MLLIEKKCQRMKEDLLTKDAKRSFSWRKRSLKVMTHLLLLLTKKELTLFVLKCLPKKVLLPSEELRDVIWKESSWLVEEMQSTLLNNLNHKISDMLMKLASILLDKISLLLSQEWKTHNHAQSLSKVLMSTLFLWLKRQLETALEQ